MTGESPSQDNLDEARSLIDGLLDGRLSAESGERLQTLVCQEPRVRALYVRVMHQECVIAAHASTVQLDFDEALRQAGAAGAAESSSLTTLHSAIGEALKIERSQWNTNSATEQGSRVDPGSTLYGLAPVLPGDGEEDISAGIQAPPMIMQQPRAAKPRRWIRPTRVAAAILLLAGSGLVIILYQLGIFGGNSPQSIAMGPSLDAVWSHPDSVAAAGSLIKTGVPQSLTSGYAELTSPSGLVVIIQGPATFTVEKAGVLSLASGKLTANVPTPAHGFTVNTPGARIVDLGTEFGVSVDASGQTDVQTFRGTVSLTAAASPPSAPANLISAGVARRVNSVGEVTEIPADTTTFVRPQQFDDWNANGTPFQRWKAYSQRLRNDPNLVAYYSFDNAAQAPGRLLNESSLGSALDGVLGGDKPGAEPVWTTGRWPQKGALEFSGKDGSRVVVRSGIGDPLDFSRGQQPASPLTVAAWIRPEGGKSGTIVAKGFGYSEQFAMTTASAWVRHTAGNSELVTKLTSFPPEGVWSQTVFTYDPIQRTIRLYRNGLLIVREQNCTTRLLRTDKPLFIGCRPGRLPAKSGAPVQYIAALHCSIDELLIMKRAMSADEVREMYQMEKPAE